MNQSDVVRKVRISRDAKQWAYDCAIAYLETEECTDDTDDDRAARKWLAKKLDKACDRLFRKSGGA